VRPISRPQSAIRAPLNTIVGTEANVRLLRVLASASAPMTQSVLANLAGLNASGAGRSLAALEEIGIIEYVGTGARRPIAFRRNHPLAGALSAMFAAERSWFGDLVNRMREVAKLLPGPPKAVWIEGPVAAGTDSLRDSVGLGVLTTAAELSEVMTALEASIDHWSDELDVTVEPRGLTLADLDALTEKEMERLAMVIPLLGPPPLLVAGRWKSAPSSKRSHHALDADAILRARTVAGMLRSDPGLVARALEALRQRMPVASVGERRELREWERILTTMSLPRLRRFLVDPGERATRLRQTMPFAWLVPAVSEEPQRRRGKAKQRS
jgi:hypothetical protein